MTTVTVGAPTLVFAHERPDLAAHAREYLTLVPLEVDRSGKRAQYFLGYTWSTIDKRGVNETSELARIDLIADGRRIPLENYSGPLFELGLTDVPVPPPNRSATLLVARASREQQEFVAGAAELRAVLVNVVGSERYELWSR